MTAPGAPNGAQIVDWLQRLASEECNAPSVQLEPMATLGPALWVKTASPVVVSIRPLFEEDPAGPPGLLVISTVMAVDVREKPVLLERLNYFNSVLTVGCSFSYQPTNFKTGLTALFEVSIPAMLLDLREDSCRNYVGNCLLFALNTAADDFHYGIKDRVDSDQVLPPVLSDLSYKRFDEIDGESQQGLVNLIRLGLVTSPR